MPNPGPAYEDWTHSDGTTVSFRHLFTSSHEVSLGLWQGGFESPRTAPRGRFDVVVNLAAALGRSVPVDYPGLYIEWAIEDSVELPDEDTLIPLVELLRELIHQRKMILVHCQAGLNRSGLVVGLILRHMGATGEQAVERIRVARDEFCLCNADFERYVREWTP